MKPSQFLKTTRLTKFLRATRLHNLPKPSKMDSRPPPQPQPAEDFVQVDDPNPTVLSFCESVADERHPGDGDCSESVGYDQRKKLGLLPEELSRRLVRLTCASSAEGGTCDVYLVGTAHVSRQSCLEVQAVVRHLKPEVVFLELCSSRMGMLTLQNLKVPSIGEIIEKLKKRQNVFGVLYGWLLAKTGSKLDVIPGSEFRVGFEEAMKYGGKVILGDRPVQITIRRTWAKMPLWHKTKLVSSLLLQATFLPSPEKVNKMMKEMDETDMLTLMIQEMSKQFPTLIETLLDERDRYMSSKLLQVAREHSSIVAVLGRGHLEGIRKHWQQPVNMDELLEIPSQSPAVSAAKVLTFVGIAAAGVAVATGIILAYKK